MLPHPPLSQPIAEFYVPFVASAEVAPELAGPDALGESSRPDDDRGLGGVEPLTRNQPPRSPSPESGPPSAWRVRRNPTSGRTASSPSGTSGCGDPARRPTPTSTAADSRCCPGRSRGELSRLLATIDRGRPDDPSIRGPAATRGARARFARPAVRCFTALLNPGHRHAKSAGRRHPDPRTGPDCAPTTGASPRRPPVGPRLGCAPAGFFLVHPARAGRRSRSWRPPSAATRAARSTAGPGAGPGPLLTRLLRPGVRPWPGRAGRPGPVPRGEATLVEVVRLEPARRGFFRAVGHLRGPRGRGRSAPARDGGGRAAPPHVGQRQVAADLTWAGVEPDPVQGRSTREAMQEPAGDPGPVAELGSEPGR